MANSKRKYRPTSRLVLGALSGVFFGAFLLQKILELVSRLHWAAAAIIAAFVSGRSCMDQCLGQKDTSSDANRDRPDCPILMVLFR